MSKDMHIGFQYFQKEAAEKKGQEANHAKARQGIRRQQGPSRAVIIGVNPVGQAIAKELQGAKRPGIHIMGYVNERDEARTSWHGLPVLGGGETLRYLAHNGMIDMAIVALDDRTHPELFQEAFEAAELGIAVLPMAVVYESATGKVPVEHIGDQWYMLMHSERALSFAYLCWKKALDLVCGICGLILLGLLLPILAPCIFLDSPGPIFYSQERVGLQGKIFRIYKLRSMQTNAEQPGSAIWATKNDARVTRVGRLMRAIHLDELPQVLNILRGDMSLIGPRPERVEFTRKFEKSIPLYRSRLAVKPGLTGWAQVKYHYARSDEDTLIKLQYDLYFVKHQSFMLDIFIILRTVAEVFLHRGT